MTQQPDEPITNYLTQWSGITPAKLKGVTVRLADVQKQIDEVLGTDGILVRMTFPHPMVLSYTTVLLPLASPSALPMHHRAHTVWNLSYPRPFCSPPDRYSSHS